MRKVSKKDQTPESIAAEQEATRDWMNRAVSQHFAVGSFIRYMGQRAEVISRPGNGWMMVRYEDQTTEILRPLALAHERQV